MVVRAGLDQRRRACSCSACFHVPRPSARRLSAAGLCGVVRELCVVDFRLFGFLGMWGLTWLLLGALFLASLVPISI